MRARFAPAIYASLTGIVIGLAMLVVAPIVHPFDSNYLIPTHWRIVLILAAIASAIGAFMLGRGWWQWAVAMAIGVLCAFMVRVQIDVARDRTNHNLLPFELILDFVSVLAFALVGALMGYKVRRRADNPTEEGGWTPPWKRPEP